jgi:hypothetical protein
VPEIPRNEQEHRLKSKILWDLDDLNTKRVRAEARATLLNSRIEFIHINTKPNE